MTRNGGRRTLQDRIVGRRGFFENDNLAANNYIAEPGA